MLHHDSLSRRFAEARLPLHLTEAPLTRTSEEIVQIDISRVARPRSELFRLYRGAQSNRVDVLGIDRGERQLVLLVHEPRRAFEVRLSRSARLEPGTRVLRREGRQVIVEQHTQDRKRHFLCGMDEAHLFIAELPRGVSSVPLAREALRAPEVPSSHAIGGQPIRRQGEWFFLPLSTSQVTAIEALARAGVVRRDIGIAQAAGLGRAGRPHVADEVYVDLRRVIFVRGHVRHPDHKTIELREWTRVVPNRERFERPQGVLWID